ncbi:hypothetical protein APS56_10575 [Pseudalgibacter alginicilyticus]|uniref:GOLD domain-containing protein n=1 Tax=Pseudalgibacter alginicilyticus TaxID=1736674 RepID=A0A0P0CQU5_9FLAO|nr:hypothetical protein [Pseudalgibacter alginicilyticus]ALJ06823.1 hypothetical protein APS56_10575 [Pseudalgibacter alginicilyticus]
MKKFLILSLTLIFLASCNVNDDDNYNYSFDVLPIESVDIPDEFTLGETYPITVEYLRPTSCHVFNDFYYYKENNERTVAVINVNYDRSDCEDLEDEITSATFNFQVTGNGSYIFKFWQGKDENDEDQYLSIEVPVVE